jgi:hypothetical protein
VDPQNKKYCSPDITGMSQGDEKDREFSMLGRNDE